MLTRYDSCLAFTWRPDFDGQTLHNTAHDPGGATAWGVTLGSYASWRQEHGLFPTTPADLGRATRVELSELIRARYWNAVQADHLWAGADLLVYDFGFGSGPGTSARQLQAELGVAVDGELGPHTLGALNAVSDRLGFVEALAKRHDDFYRSLSTYALFGHGWSRRNKARRLIAAGLNSTASTLPTLLIT